MQRKPLNVFCPERIPGANWIPVLDHVFGVRKTNELFQTINPALYADVFTVVADVHDADVILLPHMYMRAKREPNYIRMCVDIAKKHNKILLVFAYQDSAEHIDIPHSIIFRPSQYRNTITRNEIIMPAFVEDLGALYGVSVKEKATRPSVGFVGKAGFETYSQYMRFVLKNMFKHGPYKDGLYFRRKAMNILEADGRIETDFIIRSSYSGNKKSITLDPERARREYVASIKDHDTTLAPKGDGNYSLRFFETLSMGRIPIFIDTDTVLPLEDKIPYDDMIIRVDYTRIDDVADVVASQYAQWSSEEYTRRQRRAREVFETYLYMPAFLKEVCTMEYLSSRRKHM